MYGMYSVEDGVESSVRRCAAKRGRVRFQPIAVHRWQRVLKIRRPRGLKVVGSCMTLRGGGPHQICPQPSVD